MTGIGDGPARPTLVDYPLTSSAGHEHVAALSDVLAQFGRSVHFALEAMHELEDPVSADVLTEVLRGIDKWLWFVEAHAQKG